MRGTTPDFLRHTAEAPAGWVSDKLAHWAARDADVIVGSYSGFERFGLEDLAGKTVVTNAISDERLADLGSRGVDLVIDATPQPFHVVVVASMLGRWSRRPCPRVRR